MNCPVCSIQLNMMERQGVEIDYCSKCRGVWLDRGELDKIIERSGSGLTGNIQQPQTGYNQPPQHNRSDYNQSNYPNNQSGYNQPNYSDQKHGHSQHKHKKKESFLSELFDFD
ncbi:MAG TPA: zf-TFIIB domain-containing protein [Pyrinomonadaceae bacterium]|nr:zf-TFIIB domain-containing protein [Pyrinomonadaceae bacterium]